MICGKYELNLNGWDPNQKLPSSNRSPWKGIITSLPSFVSFSKLIVGNEQNIRFWVILGQILNLEKFDFLGYSTFP